MEFFKKTILTILSAFSLIVITLTVFQFTRFLSNFPFLENSYSSAPYINMLDVQGNYTAVDSVSYATQATVIDISLLCIFIIQHSSLLPLQDIISGAIRLPVLSRTFLNMLTSASLQLLMYFWKPIPQYTVWVVDTADQSRQFAFVGMHVASWLLIYVMMITMDITDLLGLKQVYYYVTGRPSPAVWKSLQLQDLHHKMRHPSLVGFALIFWIYPYMSLDRLLLAVVWSLYMVLVWRPDSSNYNYLVQQQAVKKSVL